MDSKFSQEQLSSAYVVLSHLRDDVYAALAEACAVVDVDAINRHSLMGEHCIVVMRVLQGYSAVPLLTALAPAPVAPSDLSFPFDANLPLDEQIGHALDAVIVAFSVADSPSVVPAEFVKRIDAVLRSVDDVTSSYTTLSRIYAHAARGMPVSMIEQLSPPITSLFHAISILNRNASSIIDFSY